MRMAVSILFGMGVLATWPLAAQPSGVCETDETYQALDFLVGEWRLVSGGEVVGGSSVEKLADGCLIAETWTFADGRSGRTYSAFDVAAGVWRRFSVSNGGALVRSEGKPEEGELVLSGEFISADGRRSIWRERLTRDAAGRISAVSGYSRRAGRGDRPSTLVFEGTYEPVGLPVAEPPAPVETAARPPAPVGEKPSAVEPVPDDPAPAEPRPAPAPVPAAGEVTAESARADDAAAIERIAMASPMVLRLPLGKVESLPEGYGWITRDTAPYLCEGITIESVQVERRVRRGRVELGVELAVHGTRAARRVNVGVELRRSGHPDADDAVASGAVAGRVGRTIPAQIEHGSVALEIPLAMGSDAFDEIVADAERPELVITLTVGR